MVYNVLSTVGEFIATPESNFGFIIINSRMSQEVDFVSSEGTSQELRPKLTVVYDDNTIAVQHPGANPAAVGALNVRTVKNGIRLIGTMLSSPVTYTITTPGGRLLSSGRLTPGSEKEHFVPGSGIVIVSAKTSNGRMQIYSVLIP